MAALVLSAGFIALTPQTFANGLSDPSWQLAPNDPGIWEIEKILNEDINGDGHIGRPPIPPVNGADAGASD